MSHRRDLNTTIRDAFSCDEFFVELTRNIRLDGRLHLRSLLAEGSINIEVLGLDDMMLLSLEDALLFQLPQVNLLLHVERHTELA